LKYAREYIQDIQDMILSILIKLIKI